MKWHSGIPGNVNIFSNSHACPSPSAVKSHINTLKGTYTPPSKERFYQVLQFKNNQHLFNKTNIPKQTIENNTLSQLITLLSLKRSWHLKKKRDPPKEKDCLPTINFQGATVDGQNPAPPRMMIIPLFIGFLTIPGGAGFFHQQYVRFREGKHLPKHFIHPYPSIHLPKHIQALKERVGQFPCFYGNLQKMVPSNMGYQENTGTNMYIYVVYTISSVLHSCMYYCINIIQTIQYITVIYITVVPLCCILL